MCHSFFVLHLYCKSIKVKGGELSSMEQFRGILETLEERNVLQTVCTGNKKLVYASPFLYADL